MVGAVHSGPIERQTLRAPNAIANSGEQEAKANAEVPEHVQMSLPSKEEGGQHPNGRDDEHVRGDEDVGEERTDAGNDHGGIINEKPAERFRRQRALLSF